MSLTTPQDIITFAQKAMGILGVGQTALAEDNGDALNALNGMIGQWTRKRWIVYHLIDVAVTTTGAMSYTVGPGCDFNVPRVDRLEAAFFRQYVSGVPGQTYVDYPLTILEAREAVDFKIRSLRKVQKEKENAALAGKLQPKRPQTVEERMRAIDELVERMTSGGAAG